MRIGIDLGGTKIEAVALDADGTELCRIRVATPRGDYDATLAAISRLVAEIEAQTGCNGSVGIGIPGSPSPRNGLIRNANSTWLIGRPLQADLEARLGRPVRIANDADCFTLSEASDGAAAGAASVFGVMLGTGVGGGIVVEGRLLGGPNAIAGEWGHNPLPWPPEESPLPCYCGKEGCIETWLSGPALCARYHRRGGEAVERAEALVARAEAGDPLARQLLADHAEWLARALASVINLLDPEVIVLGGGLSRMEHLYRQVPERWQRWVFSDQICTRLLPPRFGDSSGVRGAAWLWPL